MTRALPPTDAEVLSWRRPLVVIGDALLDRDVTGKVTRIQSGLAATFGVVGLTRALAVELAGQVGVTLLIPGGMRTAFFDRRTEQYRPGADAEFNDPDNVAAAVMFALSQPAGCEMRELVVCPSTEPSYP